MLRRSQLKQAVELWMREGSVSRVYSEIYVHLVWATKGREPSLLPDIRRRLYEVIRKQCTTIGVDPLAVGGVEDHVHLLVTFPTTVSISEITRRVKGASSHFMSHEAVPGKSFEWQKGYGVFTLHRNSVESVRRYIDRQEEHHRKRTLIGDLEIVSPKEAPQVEACGLG